MPISVITDDYNRLASGYDQFFSDFTMAYSHEMVRKLDIRENSTILDLACGTGTITAEINKQMNKKGKIVAVDISDAMISKAKEKVVENIEFICGDMQKVVKTLPMNSFDYITCGWAIGYVHPVKFLKKIKKILKHKGKVGIIENRTDTLTPLRKTGIKVMQRYPRNIRYIMDLPVRLPRNKRHLEKIYRTAGLRPLKTWEGKVNFNFKTGEAVLNWALHTGASAGFDKIMDPTVKNLCDEAFVEIIEKYYKTDQGIDIAHKYVAGIAQKA